MSPLRARVLAAVLAAASPVSPAAPPANADIAAVVTVALGVAVPTLDPGIPAGTPAATVRRHIYEGLVSMTEDGKIVPELASEWTVSKDGLTWTFKLRRGVQFHDGTPFDAAAMKASLDRILDPKEASAQSSLSRGDRSRRGARRRTPCASS